MIMRFYTTAENRRGNTVSTGLLAGNPVHTRGWNAGVKVVPMGAKGSADYFDIYMTTGSHESGHDVLIGTVTDTPAGPVFFRAGEATTSDAMTSAYSNGVTS
jgi:hypothetical protein